MFRNIRAEMTRHQMTAADCAKLLGISKSAFNKKLRGAYEFRLSEVAALARHWNCSIDYLSVIYKTGGDKLN